MRVQPSDTINLRSNPNYQSQLQQRFEYDCINGPFNIRRGMLAISENGASYLNGTIQDLWVMYQRK